MEWARAYWVSNYGSEGQGFESLRARSTIRTVTSVNADRGLDSFPPCAAIFHDVAERCSDGAPLSPCRPGRRSCRWMLTRAFVCRLVWIMAEVPVGRPSTSVHNGYCCRSSLPVSRRRGRRALACVGARHVRQTEPSAGVTVTGEVAWSAHLIPRLLITRLATAQPARPPTRAKTTAGLAVEHAPARPV